MNHYNIAVTVGPNIFRSKEIKAIDLINAGTFYDIMIRLMQNFDEIFGSGEETLATVNLTFGGFEEEKQDDGVQSLAGSSNDMFGQCMKFADAEEEH